MATGYEGPNYTQTPNILFDEHMADMSEAELKVVLAVVRKTLGWQKQRDQLSLSQLMELTGLSRQGVVNGVEAAIKRGVIDKQPKGQSFTYGLVVNEVDQSTKQTSQRSRPVLVNEVDQLAPKLVNEVDTQKKDLNKDLKKKGRTIVREESPSAHRSPVQPSLVQETEPSTPLEPKAKTPPTPPASAAPPSPDKEAAAACWEMYLKMIEEFEPKIVLAFGRERKGINQLAKAGRTPDEIELAFRALKRENFWRGTHLSAQSLGQQMGAVLAKSEPQEAQVLEYAW